MALGHILDQLPKHGDKPLLGRILLLEEIGRGSVGVVHGGWHEGLDIPVAIKFLVSEYPGTESLITRFQREARICAELDEPNLLRVLDFATVMDVHYFVMEWVPGSGLDDIIEQAGTFSEQEAMTVMRDVGQALIGLHRRGIVHRDIKPSNILLRARDGRIKLADLGLATEGDKKQEKLTQNILGTPAYMSPEQIANPSGVDGASDLFSLGTTVFTLLAGSAPFSGGTIWETISKLRVDPLPDLLSFRNDLSADIIKLLGDLTKKNPLERIRTAEELLDRLPVVSFPFRTSTLDAARPEHELRRPKEMEKPPEFDNTKTIAYSPLPAMHTLYAGEDFAAPPEPDDTVPTAPVSLLFCQCLQNDFIAPIGKGRQPPNKLHIGWSESVRIVGENAAGGPLVSAVGACASSVNTRIIYIRDWHDPNDPLQRPELDFFGDHCLIGSPGARFIESIEHYSRDRSRSAVLDAVAISDFEDTPIVDIIDALVGNEPKDTIPVGVMGVWTNVKIHYLLYDLKTRLRFQNLATCSCLVASPNRVAHGQTLKHLEEVLGVKIYHNIEEFLAFLGVTV